jgi:hypothetical protein
MVARYALVALVLAACPGPDDPDQPEDVTNDPANTTGFQFATPLMEVQQGVERQDCYFTVMPDLNAGQPYYIDHIRLGVNPGSHHANIFRVKTVVLLDGEDGDVVNDGECFKSSNWADWPLVANNQDSSADDPYFDWNLPAGVAFRFEPGEKIMVQTHYVNASTQETPQRGKVVVDMYRSDDAAPIEMGTLFATQQSIRVCESQPVVSFSGACAFPTGTINIAGANGHFHSRGTKFEMFAWDGISEEKPAEEFKFYTSTSWDDPPMSVGEPLRTLPSGGGVYWTCDFEWLPPDEEAGGCDFLDGRDPSTTKDCCYTFGGKVETSEHCNAFVYYWPKVDDINCF